MVLRLVLVLCLLVPSLALDQGEPQRAISELEGAARLVPHASEIHNHLGLAYAEAGRVEEARRAFQRALVLDCDNRAARANLAWIKVEGVDQ